MFTRARLTAIVCGIALFGSTRAEANDVAEFNRLGRELRSQTDARQYAQAEASARQMVALAEGSLADHPDALTQALHGLGYVLVQERKHSEAVTVLRRAAQLHESAPDPKTANAYSVALLLAEAYSTQNQFSEAAAAYGRAASIATSAFGAEHDTVVDALRSQGIESSNGGQGAAAEEQFAAALAMAERLHGASALEVARVLNDLGHARYRQRRSREAIEPLERAVRILEAADDSEAISLARALRDLAMAESLVGKMQSAEAHLTRALALFEKLRGPDHLDVIDTLYSMGRLLHDQGRYREAAIVLTRALKSVGQSVEVSDPLASYLLRDLAHQYWHEGKYAESEPLHRQALAMRERFLGPDDPAVADSLMEVADLLIMQKQIAEAQRLAERALTILERHHGVDSPRLTDALIQLAKLKLGDQQYSAAEQLLQRALRIQDAASDFYAINSINIHTILGRVLELAGRFEEAEKSYQQALAFATALPGDTLDRKSEVLRDLALLYFRMERWGDAEAIVDDVVTNYNREINSPGDRSVCYVLRAQLAWRAGRKSEAIEDLREAQALAELARAQLPGNEQDRAAGFERYLKPFQLMVAWQAEAGNPSEAFTAAERGRARSLLDELTLAGADLQLGRPAAERQRLAEQERELKTRVADLERQLSLAANDAERRTLLADLEQARGDYYEFYNEQRTSSPLFRSHLSAGSGPPRLRQIQQRVVPERGHMLLYCLGTESGHVLSIGRDSATVEPLSIDDAQAQVLGVSAGPLTIDRMEEALLSDSGGVLRQLAKPGREPLVIDKLAALWQVLAPEATRQAIAAGEIESLIVVPDAALASLPFEALVLEAGANPKYLLDTSAAVRYAPSATVLFNLLMAHEEPTSVVAQPVLSVGNPNYRPREATSSAREQAATDVATRAGGALSQLPYSDLEVNWVQEAFDGKPSRTMVLRGDSATEAQVRSLIAGKRIVHFACHGLVDQSLGNFFGALALTPGANAATDPRDDGYLRLPEIYELDLSACELAILSACQTNYGPQQQGEGVWALSRGFVVAGAQRVVASNWLVDDQAAASAVSYFCAGVAQAEKKDQTPNYARALQAAKRYVRQQPRWQDPYYWATFVLVGPE
ncbi:MAG: CHAT domain-containing protein [Pirellulales bacterium]|nr:CHAT domain-containing protein [Pirellulales bacterium]